MDVSIIIVNYKTAPLIVNCIQSIIRMTTDIEYEIIVVDNHSDDNVREILYHEFKDQVRVLLLDENLGFGRANNIGFQTASGRNILCLNPDTLLLNNAVKILSDYLDKNERVGACGGNLYDEEMNPSLSFRRLLPGIRWELCEITVHKLESLLYNGNWMFNHSAKPLKVAYITGADLMIKRSVLNKTAGFASDFFMYYEETDLCLRITGEGFSIMSVPNAKIQHLEGKCFKASGEKKINEIGLFLSEQGRYIYYHRNITTVKRFISNSIYFCSLLLLYAISTVTRKYSSKAFYYRIKIFISLSRSKKA